MNIKFKKFAIFALVLSALLFATGCQIGDIFNPQPNTYTIGVNATVGGTVAGAGEYSENSLVVLTATANSGYIFNGWYFNDTYLSNSSNYAITVTQTKVYEAKFLLDATNYTVDTQVLTNGYNVDFGGIVNIESSISNNLQTLKQEKIITLTAVANSGYTFVAWKSLGQTVSTDAVYTATLTNNKTYVAEFIAQENIALSLNGTYYSLYQDELADIFVKYEFNSSENTASINYYLEDSSETYNFQYGIFSNYLVLYNENVTETIPVSKVGEIIYLQIENSNVRLISEASILNSYIDGTYYQLSTKEESGLDALTEYVFTSDGKITATHYVDSEGEFSTETMEASYYLIGNQMIVVTAGENEQYLEVNTYEKTNNSINIGEEIELVTLNSYIDEVYYQLYTEEENGFNGLTEYVFTSDGKILATHYANNEDEFSVELYETFYYLIGNYIIVISDDELDSYLEINTYELTNNSIILDGISELVTLNSYIDGTYYQLSTEEEDGLNALTEYVFTSDGKIFATHYLSSEDEFSVESYQAFYYLINNNIIVINDDELNGFLQINTYELTNNSIILDELSELVTLNSYIEGTYYQLSTEAENGLNALSEIVLTSDGKIIITSYIDSEGEFSVEIQEMDYYLIDNYIIIVNNSGLESYLVINTYELTNNSITFAGVSELVTLNSYIDEAYYNLSTEAENGLNALTEYVFTSDGKIIKTDYIDSEGEFSTQTQEIDYYLIDNYIVVVSNDELYGYLQISTYEITSNSIIFDGVSELVTANYMDEAYYQLSTEAEDGLNALSEFVFTSDGRIISNHYIDIEGEFSSESYEAIYYLIYDYIVVVSISELDSYIQISAYQLTSNSIIIDGTTELVLKDTAIDASYGHDYTSNYEVFDFDLNGNITVFNYDEQNMLESTATGNYYFVYDKLVIILTFNENTILYVLNYEFTETQIIFDEYTYDLIV